MDDEYNLDLIGIIGRLERVLDVSVTNLGFIFKPYLAEREEEGSESGAEPPPSNIGISIQI